MHAQLLEAVQQDSSHLYARLRHPSGHLSTNAFGLGTLRQPTCSFSFPHSSLMAHEVLPVKQEAEELSLSTRSRTRATPLQKRELDAFFTQSCYASTEQLRALSERINL
jgi:hypothetical protein